MRTLFKSLLTFIFVTAFAVSAFAAKPHRVLQLKDLEPGTGAIGFSVFKGTEPQPFDVVLGEPIDEGGSTMILIRISGGPMDTPLEKIGGIAGMSGSPIFIDCIDKNLSDAEQLNFCEKNGTLVGALSQSVGFFMQGGPNALATPAEYMLGARSSGYGAAFGFSGSLPGKINVNGREFTNLPIAANPSGRCHESVKSDIKPGSMVSLFLGAGIINVGGSGTVTWRDDDKIYIFGHPLYGTGAVSYPFVQVSVADTLQTPFDAKKLAGCQLDSRGAILMDGAFEMSGVIGKKAETIPYQVEMHMGKSGGVMYEEVASSPMASVIIRKLPNVWLEQWFGDLSGLSLAYQFRITLAGQPEIFARSVVPAHVYKDPIEEVFKQAYSPLKILKESGFDHQVEGIKVRLDFINQLRLWKKNKVFLSKEKAQPGETVYANVVLDELLTGASSQMSIPIKVPEDFMERVGQGGKSDITVIIQSRNKFTDKQESADPASVDDLIGQLNKTLNYRTDVLYVQQILPRTKSEFERNNSSAMASVKQPWKWTGLQEGDLKQLPMASKTEVILNLTPALGDFIDLDSTLTVTVQPKAADTTKAVKEKASHRKWFLLFLK